ncbi:hypothetical protein AXF42_Ash005056 [Apostasia shenzhenica]|uniref:Uncharacterized protein n=1 Tax=Apostasia shenzhenica TaxID=1088818 RepID=A0A2I0B8B8_9ASPA|nr:hypothetical protein AXF42_Ash005056 [Apostasia shenzhenica]
MSVRCIKKGILLSVRVSWRSISRHPFLVGLLFFMLLLYRYFPTIFAFIIYSSPVLVCTALLLGALLVYGEPNIPGAEEPWKNADASVEVRSDGDDVAEKRERYISESNTKNRSVRNVARDATFMKMQYEEVKDATNSPECSSGKINEREIQREKIVTNELKARNLEFVDQKVFSIENQSDCALNITGGLDADIGRFSENQFESSLASPWQPIDSHDESSVSGSDEEESLSPDASMTDMMPMLDELHPLLEFDNPEPSQRSIDTSDAASRGSSPDHESDDGSAEVETENQADEEDEDPQEEKDKNEAVVKWTADDQKNLMDLGSSEIERNRRLENLMAKRRARKLQRFQTDKNLIDLDTEPLPFMEEMSRLNVQVAAISAPRHNPFDLPYDSQESMGLPPVPGSAPSVLLPRRNPFDLPYEQVEGCGRPTGESSKHDVPLIQSEILDRNGKLNVVVNSEDFKVEKTEPKLMPYFVAEKMGGTISESCEGQLSEKSDSKESSTVESDSTSSVVDEDHELSEREIRELMPSANQDMEFVERVSQFSEVLGSGDIEHEQNNTVEEDTVKPESCLLVPSAVNSEVIEEKYDASSSSSFSEEEKNHGTSIHVESTHSSHRDGDSAGSSNHSMPSDVKEAEGTDDNRVADPVYDSSPSANSVSHIASLGEDLFRKGEEKLNTGALLPSDMQINLSKVISPGESIDKGSISSGEDFNSEPDSDHTKAGETKNFHVEEIKSDAEVHKLQLNSSRHSGSGAAESSSDAPDPPTQLQNSGEISEPLIETWKG